MRTKEGPSGSRIQRIKSFLRKHKRALLLGGLLGTAVLILLVTLALFGIRLNLRIGEELRIAFGVAFIALRIVYVPLLLLWVNLADPTIINSRPFFAALLYVLVGLQFYWGVKILSILLGQQWFRRSIL